MSAVPSPSLLRELAPAPTESRAGLRGLTIARPNSALICLPKDELELVQLGPDDVPDGGDQLLQAASI